MAGLGLVIVTLTSALASVSALASASVVYSPSTSRLHQGPLTPLWPMSVNTGRGRKHGMYTAGVPVVHGRLHGRDHSVHNHGHVRTLYTAVQEPCTWSVHDPNMAVSRPVHSGHVHGRVYSPCTRLFTACTDPVHGHT